MINIRTIRKLADGEGLTLKDGKIITYKSGWQVGVKGVTATSPEECIRKVRAASKRLGKKANCGVWLKDGIYYIDFSIRVDTKWLAIELGKAYEQISVYGWARGVLAYC